MSEVIDASIADALREARATPHFGATQFPGRRPAIHEVALRFDQLEKILIRSAFDIAFAEEVLAAGQDVADRFGMNAQESKFLRALMADDAAGFRAILNVISSSRATTLAMATAGFPQTPAGGTIW